MVKHPDFSKARRQRHYRRSSAQLHLPKLCFNGRIGSGQSRLLHRGRARDVEDHDFDPHTSTCIIEFLL